MRLYEFSNSAQRFDALLKLPAGSCHWFFEANNLNAALALVCKLFGRNNVISVRLVNLPIKEQIGAAKSDPAQIEVNRLQNQAKKSSQQAKRIKIQSRIQKAQQQLSKINQQQ